MVSSLVRVARASSRGLSKTRKPSSAPNPLIAQSTLRTERSAQLAGSSVALRWA